MSSPLLPSHEPTAADDGAAAGTERDPSAANGASSPDGTGATARAVRHRTERDATGRVWRFVYDPAGQDPMAPEGMVRVRCTTGNARATLLARTDWVDWPRQQLLDELSAALRLQRGGTAAGAAAAVSGSAVPGDRRVARRRLVRDRQGTPWNCVYDPSAPSSADDGDRVRVRCTAGRDRIEIVLDAAWHRLGDRQLADLIAQALDARRR